MLMQIFLIMEKMKIREVAIMKGSPNNFFLMLTKTT